MLRFLLLILVFILSGPFVFARSERCLEFDGPKTVAKIRLLDGIKTLNGKTVWTFEIWMKPRTQGGGGRGRVLEQEGGGLTWYLSDDGRFGFRTGRKSSWHLSEPNVIRYWEWQHVAVCSDGTTLQFFVSGKSAGKIYEAAEIEIRDQPIWIGNGVGEGNELRWFDGWLDNLRISSTCLYSKPFSAPDRHTKIDYNPATAALYTLDESPAYPLCLDETTYNSEIETGNTVLGSEMNPKRAFEP